MKNRELNMNAEDLGPRPVLVLIHSSGNKGFDDFLNSPPSRNDTFTESSDL